MYSMFVLHIFLLSIPLSIVCSTLTSSCTCTCIHVVCHSSFLSSHHFSCGLQCQFLLANQNECP